MRKLPRNLLMVFFTMSCIYFSCKNTPSTPEQVATPIFSPESGGYTSAQSVAIRCETQGATIHYTTDGSDPGANHGEVYSSPVRVSENNTIRALASKAEMMDSGVSSATYSFGPPASPEISWTNPGSGEVTVAWSAVDGATAYNLYWKEGSTVTPSSGTKFTDASIPQSVGSLANGTRYAFLVTAQNDYGESAPSQVASAVCGKVYASGFCYNGITDVACYWVGGQRTDLSDGVHESHATGIFASGGTVYASGYLMDHGIYSPCYWTGTTMTGLPTADANHDGMASALWVSGTTVYNVGFDSYGGMMACRWTGVTRSIIDATTNARAYSVFLSDSTIYTAGWYLDYPDTGSIIPCYWTGTTRTELDYPYKEDEIIDYFSHANSIFVSDGTVYTAGCIYDRFGYQRAVYWEGETMHYLSGGEESEAFSIAVSGGTVYTAGTNNWDEQPIACYWTNTTRTAISENAIAQTIRIVGGTIYVAGVCNGETRSVPCYWVDGERIDLPCDGSYGGMVTSMLVE